MVVQDNGVVFLAVRGEDTFHIYELEGLSRCSSGSELEKSHSWQRYWRAHLRTRAIASPSSQARVDSVRLNFELRLNQRD